MDKINKTYLYSQHQKLGAKMLNFGGWHMPLVYSSQIEEHHSVRNNSGIFDVSHMGIIDLIGDRTNDFLRLLLANDVKKLDKLNKDFLALYSCMLNLEGGIIDDLIVYRLSKDRYRLVLNASRFDRDLQWIKQNIFDDIEIVLRNDLSMLAIQGPEAEVHLGGYFNINDRLHSLRKFNAFELDEVFIARTGYTGEDGFEIMIPNENAQKVWTDLNNYGVKSCGLGSRDTLRLEAGLNLYGQEMDETVNPFESALAWTLDFSSERNFLGKKALQSSSNSVVKRKLVGAILEGQGVLRTGYTVYTDKGEGEITSGSFSPTMSRSIGFARVPSDAEGKCKVSIRNNKRDIVLVKPPFVRNGKIIIDRN